MLGYRGDSGERPRRSLFDDSMSQFLIVHGPEPAAAERLFDHGLQRFARAAGLHPYCSFNAGCTRLAAFSRSVRGGPPFCMSAENSHWALGAGTWFHGSQSGAAALATVLEGEYFDAGALEGIFGVAIGDARSGDFDLAIDRLGSMHVYMAEIDGCIVLCTSLLVIAGMDHFPWDWSACRQFLGTGTVFGNRSFYDGIRKLEPATVFRFRGGRLYESRVYWNIAEKFYDRASATDGLHRVGAGLVDAMDRISSAYPSPLLDLTGGYDSRCVVAAMLASGGRFTAIVNGDDESPDVRVARDIASEFAIELLHMRRDQVDPAQIWKLAQRALQLTDGEYDVLLYFPTMLAHERSAVRFDISVNGSNGEITKGYWYELLFPRTGARDSFDAQKIAAKRFTYEEDPAPLLAHRFEKSLTGDIADLIDAYNEPLRGLPNTALLDNAYLSLRMQRWQGRIASSTQRIWPGVSPFMFSAVMEAALATPGTARNRLRFTRRLIESLNPRLAAMPLEQGYPATPVRLRNLHRFALPMTREFSGKVARRLGVASAGRSGLAAPEASLAQRLWTVPAFEKLMNLEAMASADLYDPAVMRPWLAAARAGSRPEAARLGRVLSLELVARAARSS